MLEALAINLVAGGLSSIGSIGSDKIRNILRRKRFSEDIDDLTAEFTTALKQALANELDEDARANIETNWTTIAEELDELDVVFEDEQEAVARITEAIGEGLDTDLTNSPQLREAIEIAVANAYQTALREFADRVAGTELADVFNTEANIELTATVNQVEDRLSTIQRRFRRQRTAVIRNAGITWLDPLYFERHESGDPEIAWRTGFNFAEVAADYPLPRERPPRQDGGDRRFLTDEILGRLNDGDDLVVLGDGGSGKSTVCKQVAYQWYNEGRGPVFYRTSSARTTFDEPGPLVQAIQESESEVLVVIEDAADEDTSPIYEVLEEFEDESGVSFLLDSRTTAWRSTDELAGAPRLKRHRHRLGVVEMPALDPTECQRAVEHYEALTGGEIERSSKQLHDHIRKADIGGPLVLAYELTGPSGGTGDRQTVSALHDDVHRAYLSVDRWADSDLPKTVAVMINVLNAANLPVTEAFVHALADDRDDHKTIERTLGFLEGTVFSLMDGDIQTPHQMWSALYLEQLLDTAGERMARYHFEECVDALFRLCEKEDYRAQVIDWLREEPEVFQSLSEIPTIESGRFVRQIATIGQSRPSLGVLYGTPDTWKVSLPEPCSLNDKLNWYNRRGQTHFDRGALSHAENEWRLSSDAISKEEARSVNENKGWQSLSLANLGEVAQARGNFDTAKDYHEQSLEIDRETDDRYGEAANLNNLGSVARNRGNLDAAEDYHEQSLEIRREIGDRSGEATSLNQLGLVARNRGNYDTAEEYLKQSLKIIREVGDRYEEATVLNNLGSVAGKRGNLDTEEKYLEQSLAISQEVGDRRGEASSLNNLGSVAFRNDLDTAEDYLQQSLEINRETGGRPGEAVNLDNLGWVARERGNLDTAEDYIQRSLEIARETGVRRGEAASLGALGDIARGRGDLDTAEGYLEQSLKIIREVGDQAVEVKNLGRLGLVAHERGDLHTAEDYYEEAFESLLDIGSTLTVFNLLGDIVDICERDDGKETAIKWCDRAIEIAEQVGNDEASERFRNRRAEFDRG